MTQLVAPTLPPTDGVVSLRLPAADVGDIEAVHLYSEEEGHRDESWLPLIPGAPAEQSVGDWLDAWAGRPCHNGPTLVVTLADEPRFIGIVGFRERDEGSLEMIYGVAPRWRGRGLASRAVRLGAVWALGLPGVRTVELRIAQDMVACQHVAVNGGFQLVGAVSQFVPATGETFEDLRYVLGQASIAATSSDAPHP